MRFSQLLAASCLLVLASSAPQRRRNQNVNTKFFTGNNAIDSAAWGAAIGAGTQYLANQVFNPCRGGNRGGTRGGSKGTNTRFLANHQRNPNRDKQSTSFTFILGNNNPVVLGDSSKDSWILLNKNPIKVNTFQNQVLPQQQPRWQRSAHCRWGCPWRLLQGLL